MLLLTRLLQLSIFLAIISALAGCSQQSLGPDAVARVGDQELNKQELAGYQQLAEGFTDRRMSPRGNWFTIPMDGPQYSDCIQAQKKLSDDSPDQIKPVTSADGEGSYMSLCKKEDQGNKELALNNLITGSWLGQTAAELGVTATSDQINQTLETELETLQSQSGKSREQLLSGISLSSLRLTVRDQLNAQAITAKLSAATPVEVEAYYQKHQEDLFSGLSLEEATDLIKQNWRGVNLQTSHFGQKVREATICANDYNTPLCANRSVQNDSLIFLQPAPPIASILWPEGASKPIKVDGPLGEQTIITDDPSSLVDGGAYAKDLPERLPSDPDQRSQILRQKVNQLPGEGP